MAVHISQRNPAQVKHCRSFSRADSTFSIPHVREEVVSGRDSSNKLDESHLTGIFFCHTRVPAMRRFAHRETRAIIETPFGERNAAAAYRLRNLAQKEVKGCCVACSYAL